MTQTMDELQTSVIERIKEWIHEERPKPLNVDGPWKIYVKRALKNDPREIASEAEKIAMKASNALKKLAAYNFMSSD